MKQLLITIAAVILIGCASSPVHSGKYTFATGGTGSDDLIFELKPDGSFLLKPKEPKGPDEKLIGSWKVEGEMLVVEGTDEKNSQQLKIKFNKTTGKVDSITSGNIEVPKDQLDGTIVKKHEGKRDEGIRTSEPVAKAKKPDSLTTKVTEISIQNAVFNGNIEAVKKHLDSGVDVNATDAQGMAPLHLAAWRGHKEIAEILIAKGADVNTKENTNGGGTPLHMAAMEGHKEIAELLIAEGANVNAKNNSGWIPLHDVSFKGHKEIAKLLIDKGSDVNVKGRKMQTALHVSAVRGHKEIVELLIGAESDVNAREWKGETPLDWTINDHPEIADLLRKHGGKTGEELEAAGN